MSKALFRSRWEWTLRDRESIEGVKSSAFDRCFGELTCIFEGGRNLVLKRIYKGLAVARPSPGLNFHLEDEVFEFYMPTGRRH